jgi:hypothetical protein
MNNTTPQFYCDVDPEDYITAEVTESNTALITVARCTSDDMAPYSEYDNQAVELGRTDLLNFITHLQSLVSQLDS